MIRLDNELKRALQYYALSTSGKIHRMATESPTEYRKEVPVHIENYLVNGEYVVAPDQNDKSKDSPPITPKGLELLLTLEQNSFDKRSFYLSIVALIISLLSAVLFTVQVIGGVN